MKNAIIIIIIVSLTGMYSCGKKTSEENDQQMNDVIISESQFAAEKMQLGTASPAVFEEFVQARAFIIPSTNGKAIIQLPVSGKINKIFVQPGQLITKGSRLFEVGGSEVVDIQRIYAESAAAIKRLKSEFERTKYLYEQKVNTEKEYLVIESDYRKAMANYAAAKLSIEAINLETKKIEAGEFFATYTVFSPISGAISGSQLVLGKFADSQTELMEIINTNDLQLKISVFPVDLKKLKVGQVVRFSLSGEKTGLNSGHIKTIGSMVDENLKAVDCYASIEMSKIGGLPGNQYVDAQILVSSDTLLSVPVGALLKSGSSNYVLQFLKKVESNYHFRKQKISIERTDENRIAIVDFNPSTKILTAGTYNITIE